MIQQTNRTHQEKKSLLYEDVLDKIYYYFNLDNLCFRDALRLRLINNQIKEVIDKQISKLIPTIEYYAFNLIPKGCFVCKKIENQVNPTYTSKQFINPLSEPYYPSFINCCNNSKCCFNVCKSKFKIAREQSGVEIFCNETFVNNKIPLKIKRSSGKIQENVSLSYPNIISKKNTVRVCWKEIDEDGNDVEKSKALYVEDLLKLNPHLSLNEKLQKKNIFK